MLPWSTNWITKELGITFIVHIITYNRKQDERPPYQFKETGRIGLHLKHEGDWILNGSYLQ